MSAIISTMLASVHPVSLTAANWASDTLPRASIRAFANATACLAKTPPKVTLVRQRAVEGLAASGLADRAMHAGEQAPVFRLRDGYGGAFTSREALRRGPMVLVFYRGEIPWVLIRSTDAAAKIRGLARRCS